MSSPEVEILHRRECAKGTMPDVTIEEQLYHMDPVRFDTFPHGIIQLDPFGCILYYNDAEAQLAKRSAQSTIGLNFFKDVAPCTAVQAFQGRFEAFLKTPSSRCEKFDFVFRFAWGDKEVGITLVRRVDGGERIYIVVNSETVA